jgi:flagellar assembly protein FliH
MSENRRSVRVVVSGRVQGVGFRWWTVEQAARRRLDGWVRNRPDGSVEALLQEAVALPFTLRDEPTLGEGQVYLRLGDSETRIDLDRATAEITAAVRGFFELTHQERKHG